jgi:DNA-binding PadR family transcriptional regulator
MDKQSLTDAELVILSLIIEQPMHGYEIEGQITLRNMRAWTDLATSSIYYLLGKLVEKGLIEQTAGKAESQEKRPKKVYQATENGRSTWKEATLDALRKPRTTYTNFLMGVHNLWNIPPAEALEAVITYRDWLEGDLQRQRDEQSELEAMGVSQFPLDVLFDYSYVLGDAELSFLAELISRLEKMVGETT